MGMTDASISPNPSLPGFGQNVVRGIEFVVSHTRDKSSLRRSAWILGMSLALLGVLLVFVFRHNPFGTEAQLVYATCFGAFVGVWLALLISSVVRKETIKLPALLEQVSLACFLGFVYGAGAVEAGSLRRGICKAACR